MESGVQRSGVHRIPQDLLQLLLAHLDRIIHGFDLAQKPVDILRVDPWQLLDEIVNIAVVLGLDDVQILIAADRSRVFHVGLFLPVLQRNNVGPETTPCGTLTFNSSNSCAEA
jgi:hypothetical protein